jgi:hypothetical protein
MMADGAQNNNLIEIAANTGKYYSFLAQSLRALYDEAMAAQLPVELLESQISEVWKALQPALEKNQVVKTNMAKVAEEVNRIRKAYSAAGAQDPKRQALKEEAERYGSQVQEKARVISDLVGLFRRL